MEPKTLAISEGNIRDLLIPFLNSLGYDNISKIDLGPWKGLGSTNDNGRGTIPLRLEFKKEVELLKF